MKDEVATSVIIQSGSAIASERNVMTYTATRHNSPLVTFRLTTGVVLT